MMILPSEEDTRMELSFRDGQDPLTVDAFDIDQLILTVHSMKVERSEFYTEFCRLFKTNYNRTISKYAATHIINAREKIMEDLKKNISESLEPTDSTESLQATPEN